MNRLAGQVIAITGATGGIGSTTAALAIEMGAQVVVSDLDASKVNALVATLGPQARGMAVDVSRLQDYEAMVQLAESAFGQLNGLFLNAGIEGSVKAFKNQTEADWARVFDINFHGVRFGALAGFPALERAGGGSIVITSSVAGVRGAAGLSPYVSSKHAVIGLMRSLATEWGPANIRVNTINPGPVDNSMMRRIEDQMSPEHGEEIKQAFTTRIPLGRYVTNEECAQMATFLLSDASAGMTGNTYFVDGGYTAS